MQEEVAEAPISQEQVMKEQVLGLLASQEGAPDQSMIDEWKRTYGKTAIQVMAFGEENVYIYKHTFLETSGSSKRSYSITKGWR